MGYRTETGLQHKLSEWFWKIRENMLYSDIQDIEYGINTLSKDKTFWQRLNQKVYLADMNTSYSVKENIEIMKLLIKQKKKVIAIRQKHKEQIHLLNIKFNNIRCMKK